MEFVLLSEQGCYIMAKNKKLNNIDTNDTSDHATTNQRVKTPKSNTNNSMAQPKKETVATANTEPKKETVATANTEPKKETVATANTEPKKETVATANIEPKKETVATANTEPKKETVATANTEPKKETIATANTEPKKETIATANTEPKNETKVNYTQVEFDDALGEQYRELIRYRYNINYIKTQIDLPACITEDVVNSLRDYFLNDLYPETEKRHKLVEGFESLRDYIHIPDKLLKISTSLMGSVLKFGFYLPMAFKAAYHSWKSYIDTKELERSIINVANQLKLNPPFSNDDMILCLSKIPKDKLMSFAKDMIHLLESFTHRDLLRRTVDILKEIEKIMIKNPDTYNQKDLNAISIGLNIIQNGSKLLGSFKDKERKIIIEYILKYEMMFIEEICRAK